MSAISKVNIFKSKISDDLFHKIMMFVYFSLINNDHEKSELSISYDDKQDIPKELREHFKFS